MRRVLFIVSLTVWVFALVATTGAAGARALRSASLQARQGNGWQIPPNAAQEKSPIAVSDAVVAAGKKLFSANCQRCHGEAGKGDGPDGDPDHQEDMDLTVAARAVRNPDGIVFYKIWNGRLVPKMPVFSEQLSKEQVWAIVAYVQTLRGK